MVYSNSANYWQMTVAGQRQFNSPGRSGSVIPSQHLGKTAAIERAASPARRRRIQNKGRGLKSSGASEPPQPRVREAAKILQVRTNDSKAKQAAGEQLTYPLSRLRRYRDAISEQ
jgi:hypothetical protein